MPIDAAYSKAYKKAMANVTELLHQAIERFGSETKAAQAAGVSQPTFNEAKKLGRAGPKLAIGIDRATDGEISKSELRPDLWPPHEGQSQ